MAEGDEHTIYIGCQCHSPYHIVRVSLFEWTKEPPELYFELQADRHQGFWNRLKSAVRYVFGQENLGWHDVIPEHNDVVKLQNLLYNYTECYKAYKENKNGK